MSFVRLDCDEFPPLDKVSQSKKIKHLNGLSPKHFHNRLEANNQFTPSQEQQSYPVPEDYKSSPIVTKEDFIRCRVGYKIANYTEDLNHVLQNNQIGRRGDFILAQIEPTRPYFYEGKFTAISDLVLSTDDWHSRVAIDLGSPTIDGNNMKSVHHFDRLLRHALYLSSLVVVIDCPDSDPGYVSVASVVNDRLSEAKGGPLVLFRVPATSREQKSRINSSSWQTYSIDYSDEPSHNNSRQSSEGRTTGYGSNGGWNSSGLSSHQGLGDGSASNLSWLQWNCLRSHLTPYSNVGVCLQIDENLANDEEEQAIWFGEPVRMIIIHTDLFVRSPGFNGSLVLNSNCRKFIKRLTLANSLKTCFVLDSNSDQGVMEYLQYLDYMANGFQQKNEDPLRAWDDKMQLPLQPLSSNLSASIYGVFELDSMKYIKYMEAMIEALKKLLTQDGEAPWQPTSSNRKLILMVLGAGRGPLVDSFIKAIKSVDKEKTRIFKIYALDKNHSSVRSLRYKQKNNWNCDKDQNYEVEVVEADMRDWSPKVKADIIATELLGSLSDNELSPECIDGVWKFSTANTISIPQSYSSHIAPICSFKLHQELYELKAFESYVYDQIYVCRLKNYYHISNPQRLFKFEHKNLSLPPSERNNERYIRLIFWSKIDTVCHGFAGYFTANLFGSISLATLPSEKTVGMESWFPAFIPLEDPIQMPQGTKLEVHLWRKESASSVWYQWVVTQPVRSRLYSQNGINSAMSKCI